MTHRSPIESPLRDVRPADDHASRVIVLDTLDTQGRDKVTNFLAAQFRAQDLDWLRSARELGLFRFAPARSLFVEWLSNPPPAGQAGSLSAVQLDAATRLRESPMIEQLAAAIGVFEGVTAVSTDTDPRFGKLLEPFPMPVLAASEGFKTLMHDIVSDFVSDARDFRSAVSDFSRDGTGQSVASALAPVYGSINRTAATLMAISCALDDPDSVKKLAKALPKALEYELDPQLHAGANFVQFLREVGTGTMVADSYPTFFTAPYYAMHYSSNACLDAFVEAGWKPISRLGSWNHPDLSHLGVDGRHPDPLRCWNSDHSHGVTLVDLLAKQEFNGLPHTLAHALELFKEWGDFRRIDREDIFNAAVECMGPGKQAAQVPALLASGAFDFDLQNAVRKSMAAGIDVLLHHYRDRLPWDDLINDGSRESALHDMLAGELIQEYAAETDDLHEFEDIALKFLAMAHEDGYLEAFIKLQPVPPYQSGKPPEGIDTISPAVEHDFQRLLLKLLESGLDPNDTVEGVDESPLQMMDTLHREEMALIARAFLARRRAVKALCTIELESAATPGNETSQHSKHSHP